jgi:hypothetical protein
LAISRTCFGCITLRNEGKDGSNYFKYLWNHATV